MAVPAPDDSRKAVLILTGLVLLNIVVFGQTLGYSFINYDDGQYVFENDVVKSGLNGRSVAWAWSSASLGYHPLTWMSHMLDVQLYGLHPGGHHATAILLHILATLFLFIALRRMTGATMESGVVAALFAIHPMHVESVAWVSERKDTLSIFFGMLALAAYPHRMLMVALAMAASLLSKQMLLTLPFLLLLLDYWPLARRDSRRAVLEKLPLFALTIGAVAVAFAGQIQMNAVQTSIPLGTRIGNAIVAYAGYLGKLVWPVRLSVLYPFTPPSFGRVFLCTLLLLAITAAAVVLRKRAPYLIVGWLWFLGTLVPVIGIVQLGAQSMADRYTYFPYIGLFIALVWSVPRRVLVPVSAVIILLLAARAWHQTRYWKSSEALFAHAIAVTGPNPLMEYSLGQALNLTEPDRSLVHIRRAMELADRELTSPRQFAQFHAGIGSALMTKAVKDPSNPSAAQWRMEAAAEFQRAIEIDPHGAANARRNLERLGKPADAAARNARMNEYFRNGLNSLNSGNISDAVRTFQEAVAFEPNAVDARIYLALALMQGGRNPEAIEQLETAKRLDAKKANDYITKGLSMPPGENLDMVIGNLRSGESRR